MTYSGPHERAVVQGENVCACGGEWPCPEAAAYREYRARLAEEAAPEPECDVCAGPPEECGCYDEDEDCTACGGTGWCIPPHCCNCGGGEYDCICCPRCGAQNIGKCPCDLTVQKADGGTLTLEGSKDA